MATMGWVRERSDEKLMVHGLEFSLVNFEGFLMIDSRCPTNVFKEITVHLR